MLRCFLDSVPHQESACTLNGCLSLEALEKTDLCFYQAAVQGLEWDLVPAHALRLWPQLADIVQRAGNAQLHRGEHELQMVRRLHKLYLDAASKGPVDFLAIKKMAQASKPGFGSSIPSMYSFALKYAGGSSATYLQETERFVRSNAVSGKALGDDLWAAVAQDIKGDQQCPRVRHAFLKCAYLRRNIHAGDVKKALGKNFSRQIQEAEQLMNEVRVLLKHAGEKWLQDHNCQKALGFFDIAALSHMLGLKFKGDKVYKSLDGAAYDVIQLLQAATQTSIACRFEADPEEPSKAAGPAHTVQAALREFNEDGSLKKAGQLVHELGFEVGQSVKRKDDADMYGIILSISGKVTISLSDSRKIDVDAKELQEGQWQRFQPKPEPTFLEDLEPTLPQNCLDFQIQTAKALIAVELHEMCTQHSSTLSALKLQLKPCRAVIVTKKIPAKKLSLVPATLKVNFKVSQPAPADSTVVLFSPLEDVSFFLLPTTVLPHGNSAGFVAPFWCVQQASCEEEANMQLEYEAGKNTADVQIPLLKNTVELKPGDVLKFVKAKPVVSCPKKRSKKVSSDPSMPVKKVKK